MAVVLANIRARIVEALNMADPTPAAFGTVSSNAETWSKTAEIDAAILAADARVVEAILSNPKHPRRAGFSTTANVPHLGVIATHVGSVEAVAIGGVSATIPRHPDPIAEIERERSNVLALTLIEPHYYIEGSNILRHNGVTDAAVSFCGFTKSAACQSPDEYEDAVMDGAMANLFDRDGHRIDASGSRFNRFTAALQAISTVNREVAA